MERKPITKQRSAWESFKIMEMIDGVPTHWFRRRVHDGTLVAAVAREPKIGWHMSISFRNHQGNPTRYPSWDEISHGRYDLLPKSATFVMFLPPEDQYVAAHDTTFHLHEFHDSER